MLPVWDGFRAVDISGAVTVQSGAHAFWLAWSLDPALLDRLLATLDWTICNIANGFLFTSYKFISFMLKGTPLRSGRVTHLKRNFSKTYIFLLPTYLVYQNLFGVTLICPLSTTGKNRFSKKKSFSVCYTTRPQWSPFNMEINYSTVCHYSEKYNCYSIVPMTLM